METFKVLKVTVPQDVIQIELPLQEFKRLATKEKLKPLFQNNQGLFFIDPEGRIMFFTKKETLQ